MKITKIKAAIFDYDGTVMDSMGMWGRASSNYVRTVLGREPSPDIDEVIKNLSLDEGARIFREEYGAQGTDEDIVKAVLATVMEQYRHTLQPKPGITGILDDLRDHGIRMCIATASAREMIEAGNERLGLDKYFEKVFTCMEVGANKRSPAIYDEAARYFVAAPEEILVFEDVLHAARTASAAGYQLIGIYDASSADDRSAIAPLCRLYLDSCADWPGIENI